MGRLPSSQTFKLSKIQTFRNAQTGTFKSSKNQRSRDSKIRRFTDANIARSKVISRQGIGTPQKYPTATGTGSPISTPGGNNGSKNESNIQRIKKKHCNTSSMQAFKKQIVQKISCSIMQTFSYSLVECTDTSK